MVYDYFLVHTVLKEKIAWKIIVRLKVPMMSQT